MATLLQNVENHAERERDVKKEVNLSQTQEDEPALLIAELETKDSEMMFLKEEAVFPKLLKTSEVNKKSQVWYLDNGSSKHMTS